MIIPRDLITRCFQNYVEFSTDDRIEIRNTVGDDEITTSLLIFSSVTESDSSFSIECFVAELGISAMMVLEVLG